MILKNKAVSINLKLAIPLMLMGLVAIIQFSYLFYDFSILKGGIEKKVNDISAIELLSFNLHKKENNLRTFLFSFYVSRDVELIKKIKKERESIKEDINKYKGFSTIDNVVYDIDSYLNHREKLSALSDHFIEQISNKRSKAAIENTFNQWRIKEEHISSLHTDLIGSIYNLNFASLDSLKKSQQNQTKLFFAFVVINILLIISAYFITRKYITKPLNDLKKASDSVAKGDYDLEITHHSKDEVGSLFSSFISMSGNVQRFNQKLENMVEIRTSELEKEVQQRTQVEAELRKKMVELERSNRDLTQFAYVASHDLQEPLRMVASYTQLIEQRYGDQLDQDGKDFIGFAVEGAVRMQKLIKDLLEYSRVNRKEPDLELVNFAQSIEYVESNLTFLLQQSDGVLEYSEQCKNIDLVTDESLLILLLQNLISNGLKFQTDGPPRVAVEITDQDNFWKVSVADNGIGIKPEYQHRIFQVFQRLHSRTEYEGNGMGLSICQSIVEKLGGTIWVDSSFDEGSTFSFTIAKKILPVSKGGEGYVQIYQDIAR